jgi:predicted metal-dependent phosphoesterase TrpH
MSTPTAVRADLHNHSYFSPDSILSPKHLVRRARSAKLAYVAVTDHNTVRGGLEARELADGVSVIVGEEVRSADGEILGLFLEKDIPRGLSAEKTIGLIKEQGGIVGVPHPFDKLRLALRQEAILAHIDEIDFIEALNSRIVFPAHNKQALDFAREHERPVSAASDAHSPREIGRSYVELPPFAGRDGFLEALRAGRLCGRLSSPLIHLVSRYARICHRLGLLPR